MQVSFEFQFISRPRSWEETVKYKASVPELYNSCWVLRTYGILGSRLYWYNKLTHESHKVYPAFQDNFTAAEVREMGCPWRKPV